MRRLELMGLQAVMALAAVNLWTGSPVLALWIGSRAVTSGRISMTAVALVAVCMLAFSLVLIRVLAAAGTAHDRLTGRPANVRRHVPWLRSMSGERATYDGTPMHLTALERIVVVVVVVAVLLFEVWFLFLSGSPLDGRTGRG